MNAINRILLPIDFTPSAERALSFAAELASRLGAVLHLLRVEEPSAAGTNAPADVVSAKMQALVAGVGERTGRRFRGPSGVPVDGDVALQRAIRSDADAARAVLSYAAEERIDLMLVTTPGRSISGRRMEERLAERLARQAPCPVLTLTPRALHSPHVLRRILVPVAFSRASALALHQAKQLAAGTGAHLTVMHVVDIPSWYEDADEEARHTAQATLAHAFEQLEAFYRSTAGPEGPHLLVVRRGRPAPHILSFARRSGVDLIVQPAPGLLAAAEGGPEARTAAVMGAVLEDAPCAVLLARPVRTGSGSDEPGPPVRARRQPAYAALAPASP